MQRRVTGGRQARVPLDTVTEFIRNTPERLGELVTRPGLSQQGSDYIAYWAMRHLIAVEAVPGPRHSQERDYAVMLLVELSRGGHELPGWVTDELRYRARTCGPSFDVIASLHLPIHTVAGLLRAHARHPDCSRLLVAREDVWQVPELRRLLLENHHRSVQLDCYDRASPVEQATMLKDIARTQPDVAVGLMATATYEIPPTVVAQLLQSANKAVRERTLLLLGSLRISAVA